MNAGQRQCTFSSSSAWKLTTTDRKGTGFGAPALKYIKQVGYEMELGRSINKEGSGKAAEWGTFVERRVFNLLSTSYELVSQIRLFHSEIPHYSGMPDLKKIQTAAEVKCPFSLEVFCDKIKALTSGIEDYKDEYPEDYWQLISSAILLENNGFPVSFIEPIIYVPYQEEIADIRLMDEQNELNWLNYTYDNELPYLIQGKKYKNMNIFRFPVPEDDKALLKEKIIEAGQMLAS